MNIDWVQIITTVLLVIAGYLVEYFKTKSALIQKAQQAINHAEKVYESATKSGGQKFEFATDQVMAIIPAFLKPFISRDMVQSIIQGVFDSMADFTSKQLNKIVDKIGG